MLEIVRKHKDIRYIQISTDEVYGSFDVGSATEESPIVPRNPYSASKAGGDLLALSYFKSFGLDVIVTRSSNNFGPFQYPEKVMPLFITNLLEGKPIPLYGDGMNIRDWLFVEDNCTAILLAIEEGSAGEVYNIGAGNEIPNIKMTKALLASLGKPESMIRMVEDRPGHDRRYSLESTKIRSMGWEPASTFQDQLTSTVSWYQSHEEWWKPLKSGEFKEYYKKMYEERKGYYE
jgi:dTDP-glucose 4,6-dehydratase